MSYEVGGEGSCQLLTWQKATAALRIALCLHPFIVLREFAWIVFLLDGKGEKRRRKKFSAHANLYTPLAHVTIRPAESPPSTATTVD